MSQAQLLRIQSLERRVATLEERLAELESKPRDVISEWADSALKSQTTFTKGYEIRRRRGPKERYNVLYEGTPVNTEPLTLEDAEQLAQQGNEALEGMNDILPDEGTNA